jgi:hypothetical protein
MPIPLPGQILYPSLLDEHRFVVILFYIGCKHRKSVATDNKCGKKNERIHSHQSIVCG